MKIKIICCIFFISIIRPLLANENDIRFSVGTYIKYESGKIVEYNLYSEDTSKTASELEWEIKPLYFIGAVFDFKIKKFSCFLDGAFALPLNLGRMYDSDYLMDGTKFIYSIHEEKADCNYQLKTGCLYDFFLTNNINLSSQLEIFYMYNSFEARNGYGWYGNSQYTSDGKTHSWDSEYAHYFPDGKYHLGGIDYLQHNFNIYVGTQIKYAFNEKIALNVLPKISIYTYNYFKDHHLSKTGGYELIGKQHVFFKSYSIDVKLEYYINLKNQLYMSFDWNEMFKVKGNRYYGKYETENKSGSEYYFFDFVVGYKFYI